ncbi:glutamate racemase [Atopobiaceae bacterium HCP3S3_F7]
MSKDGFVGVFDSGLGGISVLERLVAELPHEHFVFFGDSANAPYGDRTVDEIRALSTGIVDRFVAEGAKAIVIACNTATSASASYLREKYRGLPIVGCEPALKPAALHSHGGRILVMATAATLRLEKFRNLLDEWGGEAEVTCVPCVGLVQLIEGGDLDAPELHDLLWRLVGRYRGQVDSVVLGCTHYPFIKRQIADVLGDVAFFDGGEGAAHQLARLLGEDGLLAPAGAEGSVEFRSSKSTPAEIELYRRFFALPV